MDNLYLQLGRNEIIDSVVLHMTFLDKGNGPLALIKEIWMKSPEITKHKELIRKFSSILITGIFIQVFFALICTLCTTADLISVYVKILSNGETCAGAMNI